MSEQEQLSSTGFFRCLLCGGPVEVLLEDEKPSVHCSCGLDFHPDVSSREELLLLWNKGLIRDVEIPTINQLFIHTQPAHLQKIRGIELGTADRNIERALYLQRHLRKQNSDEEKN